MFTNYRNPIRYDVRRDLVPPPPNSYCIVNLLVLRTTWWWPTYKVETCSCILRSIAYYVVIPSDKLLCFWLHVDVNIHIIIYVHCIIDENHTYAGFFAFHLQTSLTLGMCPVSNLFNRYTEKYQLNQNTPAGKQVERDIHKWVSTNSTNLKINPAGFINIHLKHKI